MGCALTSSAAASASVPRGDGCSTPDSRSPESPAKGSSPGRSPGRKKLTEREQAQETNEEYKAIMQFLADVPLFMRLPRDQHPILAGACTTLDFEAGQVIIRQGENGHEFFVIRSGEAEVLVAEGDKEPKEAARLKSGDYFGEQSLLRNEPRTATVRARTRISTLRITREKFQELSLHEHLQFHGRKAVAAGHGRREILTKAAPKKSTEERQLIGNALRQNQNLQSIVSLTEARIGELVNVAWMESVATGDEIIKEGDLVADYFYVVQQGSFRILRENAMSKSAEDAVRWKSSDGDADKPPLNRKASTQVGLVSAGGCFGELALLYSAPRAATVKAAEDSLVWVIDRDNFKNILLQGTDSKITEYVRYLDQCKLLSPLTHKQKEAVANAMDEVHFQKNEVVMKQGDPGSTFYVLYEGEVVVIIDGVEKARLSASLDKRMTQSFGERALLTNEPRVATIKVASESAQTLALDRDAFDLLLGPLEEIFRNHKRRCAATTCCKFTCWTPKAKANAASRNSIVKRISRTTHEAMLRKRPGKSVGRVHRRDLRKVGLLGCGGFGMVELCEHKDTGATYALKGLSKGYIVKMGMQESVMTEKFSLQVTSSNFIIAMYETYNGAQHLYFLLEPALGGELHATYNRKGLHGSERHAKYYLGGVVFAFEHLHQRRIIYRDLKPENLMLNDKGHLKLTDMGLSKFVIGKTYTTCGTPDYFAPELLASTGHTVAVDWWTLGILLFELMTGHPPFESDTHMQIFAKVMKGINKVRFPSNMQGPVEDLVKGLLQREPAMRLPMRPGGVQNIKDQAWFAGFDWKALKDLSMEPPYVPLVKSRTDLANFNAGKQDLPPQVPYTDDGSGWDKDFASST